MRKELKICLPWYKTTAAIFAMTMWVFMRGTSYLDEIGGVVLSFLTILAIMIFSDTYWSEVMGRRGEVFCLNPKKLKLHAIHRRMLIQFLFLLGIALLAPVIYIIKERQLWQINSIPVLVSGYVIAAISTILFWGILSMTLVNLIRNLWTGIGLCILCWICMYSVAGKRLLGRWNVCSYILSEWAELSDWKWLCGTGIALAGSMLLLYLIPWTIKRGE